MSTYVQSVGGVCIINGDELWIYYVGFGGDENYINQSWTTNGIYRNDATGLATLRRDGFVSMDGDGCLTTRKMTCRGKHSLHINAVGRVTAEILSETGNVLAISEPFCGDSTNARLHFGSMDITALNDTVFRIRFRVCGSLYSFGFTDESGDCGGAHAAGIVN